MAPYYMHYCGGKIQRIIQRIIVNSRKNLLPVGFVLIFASGLGLIGCNTFERYRKSCDGGDMRGCDLLGGCYENGKCGVAKDDKKVVEFLGKACTGGGHAWMLHAWLLLCQRQVRT
jgi:TPR repeat protein